MVTANTIKEYVNFAKKKPLAYASKVLGINLWHKQKEILKAFADPTIPYISVKSANGVGKTYLSATLICQYLDTHIPGYAIVSGASWTGIMKTVWPTLRRVLRNSPVALGGELLNTEWRRGDQWGAFCCSPDQPENFSGFRTENGALILVDEASALDYKVHEAIMGLASARGSKVIYLGNPLTPEGAFYDSFSNPDWINFSISAHEVADLNIPGLATHEWIAMREREWGKDSPMYKARVLGQYPDSVYNSLISLSWLPKMITPKILKPKGTKKLGVDVARFGDDRTVLLVRDDRCVIDCLAYHGLSTTETAGLVRNTAEKYHISQEEIFIDDTGVGSGVTDRLHEDNVYVTPINFAERAADTETFKNQRAELYFAIRDRVREDTDNQFYIPKQYMDLAKELTWPTYKFTGSGQILLEPKEDIKKRKKKSPDLADALALSFADSKKYFGIQTI